MIKNTSKNCLFGFQWLLIFLMVLLLTVFSKKTTFTVSLTENSISVPSTATIKLVQYCLNPRTGIDTQSASAVLDYVSEQKPHKETKLPNFQDTTCAYYEFGTRANF